MTKTPDANAETQPKESAVQTPESAAAAEAEADRLFREMAAKHTDPHKSDLRFQSEEGAGDADSGAQDDNGDAPGKATDQAHQEPNPEPAKDGAAKQTPEPGKEPAAPSASKDAPAVDDIWAKSATDPETAALRQAYDLAPETARPAIEAAQRRVLARGQEIHRLRTERSTLKRERAVAAAAPAKEPDEQPYDLTKDPEWLKAKEEYPEALSAVEKVLTRALGSTTKQIDAKVAPLAAVTAAHDEAFTEQGLRAQNAQLHRDHPNYTAVVKSDGFRDAFDTWLDDQPEEIQAMVDVNRDYVRDANKASRVFKLFQADTGFGVAQAAKEPETKEPAKEPGSKDSSPAIDPATQARRRSQLSGSVSVEARGQSSVGADPNDENYWRDYWLKKKSDQLTAESRVH